MDKQDHSFNNSVSETKLLKEEQAKEQQLLEELLNKKLRLNQMEQENKQMAKEKKKIKTSRTWKYTDALRKVSTVSSKARAIVSPDKQRIGQLEREKEELERQLQLVQADWKKDKQQLDNLQLELEKLDGDELSRKAKQAKSDGTILEYLDGLIDKKTSHDDRYNKALRTAAKLFNREQKELKQLVYSKVLTGFKIEDIPEFIVRESAEAGNVPLKQAASFRASLSIRARKRQLGAVLPEWQLEDKTTAYRFIDQLKIKRPWTSGRFYQAEEVPFEPATVIKPANGAGSRGVYLIFDSDHIQDVKREETITSREELEIRMKQDLSDGWVEQNEWMTEELIVKNKEIRQPATDLKFYCFYGKVVLILEINRFPELKYCWWTADGKRISTGKYEEELFIGKGASKQECELAASISRELPAPFVRIDFLKTDTAFVFGEFTPKPGNYDEFDTATDQLLGDSFLDAESRLIADLAAGKPFASYVKIFSEQNE